MFPTVQNPYYYPQGSFSPPPLFAAPPQSSLHSINPFLQGGLPLMHSHQVPSVFIPQPPVQPPQAPFLLMAQPPQAPPVFIAQPPVQPPQGHFLLMAQPAQLPPVFIPQPPVQPPQATFLLMAQPAQTPPVFIPQPPVQPPQAPFLLMAQPTVQPPPSRLTVMYPYRPQGHLPHPPCVAISAGQIPQPPHPSASPGERGADAHYYLPMAHTTASLGINDTRENDPNQEEDADSSMSEFDSERSAAENHESHSGPDTGIIRRCPAHPLLKFEFLDQLQTHIREEHSNGFKCPYGNQCPQTPHVYADSRCLKQHLQGVHGKTVRGDKARSYKCGHCNHKALKSTRAVLQHIHREHANASVEISDKKFTTQMNPYIQTSTLPGNRDVFTLKPGYLRA